MPRENPREARLRQAGALDRRERLNTLDAPGSPAPQADGPDDPGNSLIQDIGIGIGNGVVGAARDVISLAPGVDLGTDPVFGETQTVAGGLAQGFTNFLAGFVPAVGIVSKVGRASRLLGAARRSRRFTRAGRALQGPTIVRGAVAGAAADFAVFNGHSDRLADILDEVPELEPLIPDFLTSDEDDSDLEGRIKNTIEGLGLGLLADGFLLGLKGLRAARKAQSRGLSPEAVQREVEAATEGSQAQLDRIRQMAAEPPEDPGAPQVTQIPGRPESQATPPVAPLTGDPREFAPDPGTLGARPENNFIHPISERTPRVFRETDPQSALDLLEDGAGSSIGRDQFFVASTPDLARGQGNNRGVLIEFQSEGFVGRANTTKPAWELAWDRGAAEFVVDLPDTTSDKISAFTVLPSVNLESRDPFVRRLVTTIQQLRRSGEFVATEHADGALTLRRRAADVPTTAGAPATPGAARPPVPEAPARAPVDLSTPGGRRELLAGRRKITDEEFTQFEQNFSAQLERDPSLSQKINPRLLDEEQRAALGLLGDEANLRTLDALDEDGARFIRAFEATFGPKPDDARRPIPRAEQLEESMVELEALVDSGDPEALLARLATGAQNDREALQAINRRALAFRAVIVKTTQDVLAEYRGAGGAQSTGARAKMISRMEELTRLVQEVRGVQGEQGRGLGANRFTPVDLSDVESVTSYLAARGGDARAEKFVDILEAGLQGGDVAGAAHVAKLAQLTSSQKLLHVTTEFFMNSILSGPRTLASQVFGPIATTFYRSLENMAGGALLGKSSIVSQSAREIFETTDAFRDSLVFAKRTLKTGERFVGPQLRGRDDLLGRTGGRAVSAEFLGLNPDSAAGHITDAVGRVVNFPTQNAIASIDEFVQQVNYRSVAKAQLRQDAIDQGLGADEIADFVESNFARLTEDGQSFTVDNLRRRGLQEAQASGITDALAREKYAADYVEAHWDEGLSEVAQNALTRAGEATATLPLPEGSLSRTVQEAATNHPILRLTVFPFVKTPINLAKFAAKRIPNPLGITEALLNRQFAGMPEVESLRTKLAQELLSSDPKVAAEAAGRQAFGVGGTLFLAQQAAAGHITGRGPSDPEQRAALQESGWQPYSVRTEDGFVSYLRLDPFATLIGTVADIYDYARLAPQDEQESLQTAFIGTTVALANNFTSKTYLQGLSDFVDALSTPDRNLAPVIQRWASSFVPSALSQATEVFGDPHLREVDGLLERVRSRTPGFSDSLPPIRNLFGEPVRKARGALLGLENLPGPVGDIFAMTSPFAYREVNDDVVAQEFVTLRHGFSPPRPSKFGLDFRQFRNAKGQDAYDRWTQLQGKVRIDGRTLRQSLRRLIRSEDYQRLNPASTSVQESPRIRAISQQIRAFRDAAFDEMLKEYPALSRELDAAFRNRRNIRAGRDNPDRQLPSFDVFGVPTNPRIGDL